MTKGEKASYNKAYLIKNRAWIMARRKERAATPEGRQFLRSTWKKIARAKIEKRYPPTRDRPRACEACGAENSDGRRLCLDHCHAREMFRGWLCRKCNIALGNLDDKLENISSLYKYLQENG